MQNKLLSFLCLFFITILLSQSTDQENIKIKQNAEKYQLIIKKLYEKRNIEIRAVPRLDKTGQKIIIIEKYGQLIRNSQIEKDQSEFAIRKRYQNINDNKRKETDKIERKKEFERNLGSGL